MADLILNNLTTQERRMINTLLDQESNWELSIPEDISNEQLLAYLDISCRCWKPVDGARTILIVAIGRMLNMVQKRPDIYKEMEYRTFNDWVNKEVIEKYHISHGTTWAAKLILKSYPDLTPTEYAEAKVENLKLASQILGDNPPKRQANQLLQKAKELSVDQFKEYMDEKGLMPREESNGMSYLLKGSVSNVRFIKKFFRDPDYQRALETQDPVKMLVRLIEDNAVELRHKAAQISDEVEEEVEAAEA